VDDGERGCPLGFGYEGPRTAGGKGGKGGGRKGEWRKWKERESERKERVRENPKVLHHS
jgi:hypothetical protein